MRKDQLKYGGYVAVFFIIAIAPVVLLFLFFPDFAIRISPYPFANEYLLILGNLLPVFMAFLLVNLFWNQNIASSRFTQIKEIFSHRAKLLRQSINALQIEVNNLDQGFPKEQAREVGRLEKRIKQLLGDAEKDFDSIVSVVKDSGAEFSNIALVNRAVSDFIHSFGSNFRKLKAIKGFTGNTARSMVILKKADEVIDGFLEELSKAK